jgi:hypothetical protein
MTEKAQRLLKFVGVGEKNAVSAKKIQAALGFSPRITRLLKAETREGADPYKMIISSNKGYFVAENIHELERYASKEFARARENRENARAAVTAKHKVIASAPRGEGL